MTLPVALTRLVGRIPRYVLIPLAALALVYLGEAVFVATFGQPLTRSGVIQRRVHPLPNPTFYGWDSHLYFQKVDRYEDPAFPPAYPMLLKLMEITGINRFAGAQVINFVSHLFIVFGIYAYLARLRVRPDYLLVIASIFFFPAHNVYHAAYAESAFLALSIWGAVFFYRGRPGITALLLTIALLFRTQGVFLAAAFFALEGAGQVERKSFNVRSLLVAGLPLMVGLLWNVLAYSYLFHVSYADLFAGWREDWTHEKVLLYLAFEGRWTEVVFFWFSLGALAVLYRLGMHLEFLYLAFFHLSFLLHVYRPFAYSRYLSAFFPVVVVGVALLETFPRAKPFYLAGIYFLSCYYQFGLFSGLEGEP